VRQSQLERRSWQAGFNGEEEEGAASDGDAIIAIMRCSILLKMATAEKSFVCGFVGSWGKVCFSIWAARGESRRAESINFVMEIICRYDYDRRIG
jgi:hypothetical protein